MYNDEIKRAFIETRKDYEQAYVVLFNQTAPYETHYGKDVCDFTFSELIYMYKMWNLRSDSTLWLKNSYLKYYEVWANENGYKNSLESPFNIVTTDILQQCINQSLRKIGVISRDELLKCINKSANPREQFMTLALFEFGKGKSYEDIFFARMEDINVAKHQMKLHSGRIVEISDELIKFVNKSSKTDEYFLNEKNSAPLIDDGTIIKRFRNSSGALGKGLVVYNGIRKLLQDTELGNYVSTLNIESSGMIWFIKEKAKQANMEPADYLMANRDLVGNQFHKKQIIVKTFVAKYGDFL